MKRKPEAALTFVAFCLSIGVKLEPGQHVIAAIAFDGAEPGEAAGRALEYVPKIFGAVTIIPKAARAVVAAVCGARAGKSYVLLALRLLWGALVRDLSSLAPGEVAVAPIVAPNMKLAQQTLNYIRGALDSMRNDAGNVVYEGKMLPIVTDASEQIVIRRPDGKEVAFRTLAAGRGGAAVRGRAYTDAAMDEAAFFRDAQTGVINDLDIYRALAPRILPGGQLLIVSTPWAEQGLLYDLFRQNRKQAKTAISIHAPTLLLRDNADTREQVERETLNDPENAAREYGAEFIGGGAQSFFEAAAVDSAIDPDMEDDRRPQPGEYVTVGGDFGFRSDSSAVVIVHRSQDGEHYWVAGIKELRPREGKPLKPSETVKEMAEFVRPHGAASMMTDMHYRETIAEHLMAESMGLLDAPSGAVQYDPFVRTRLLLREGKIHLPDNARLRAQLKAVIGKPLPGGGLRIIQPRLAKGGHGDIVSALVLAIWQAGGLEVEEARAKPNTDDWRRQQLKQLIAEDDERHAQKGKQEWWEAIGDNSDIG